MENGNNYNDEYNSNDIYFQLRGKHINQIEYDDLKKAYEDYIIGLKSSNKKFMEDFQIIILSLINRYFLNITKGDKKKDWNLLTINIYEKFLSDKDLLNDETFLPINTKQDEKSILDEKNNRLKKFKNKIFIIVKNNLYDYSLDPVFKSIKTKIKYIAEKNNRALKCQKIDNQEIKNKLKNDFLKFLLLYENNNLMNKEIKEINFKIYDKNKEYHKELKKHYDRWVLKILEDFLNQPKNINLNVIDLEDICNIIKTKFNIGNNELVFENYEETDINNALDNLNNQHNKKENWEYLEDKSFNNQFSSLDNQQDFNKFCLEIEKFFKNQNEKIVFAYIYYSASIREQKVSDYIEKILENTKLKKSMVYLIKKQIEANTELLFFLEKYRNTDFCLRWAEEIYGKN